MASTVRAALVQTTWTGDKETMIKAHEEYAREAASQGARVICFQELFYGPYFCQVQDAALLRVRRVDPRSDHRALPGARRRARHGVRPADVRAGAAGRALQHRRRGRRRRQVPRQVPQAPHPAGEGLLGEVLLPARQPRVPRVRHRRRQGRRLHLLRPPLPRGVAGPRAQRRADRVQPVGDAPRPVGLPLEARAARLGGRQRVLHRRHQPGRHRGPRRERLLRDVVLRRPRRQVRRRARRRPRTRARRPRPRHGPPRRGPQPVGSSTATAGPRSTTG